MNIYEMTTVSHGLNMALSFMRHDALFPRSKYGLPRVSAASVFRARFWFSAIKMPLTIVPAQEIMAVADVQQERWSIITLAQQLTTDKERPTQKHLPLSAAAVHAASLSAAGAGMASRKMAFAGGALGAVSSRLPPGKGAGSNTATWIYAP